MKVFYKRQRPSIIKRYSCKYFANEVFMADVQNRISQKTPENNNFEFGRLEAALNKTILRQSPRE